MILQEGRYYRARDGAVYGPIRESMSSLYPFFFGAGSWTPTGEFNVNYETPNDLIAEITELEAKPPVPSPDATPKVDRVVLASKILPRLAPNLVPSMAARQALQYADAFLKEIEND